MNKKQGYINNLSELDKAYIAGLFDADGCVSVSRIKSRSSLHRYDYKVVSLIVNTDEEIINWLKETIGAGCSYILGKNNYNPAWKPCHRFQLDAERSRSFLKAIYPYLHIKKERVTLALKMPTRRMKTRHGKQGRTQEEYIRQGVIYDTMKKLNKRGTGI